MRRFLKVAAAAALAVFAGCGPQDDTAETADRSEMPVTATTTLYDEALASGWTSSWSWSSNITVGSTNRAYSGTHSIAWTATSAWGGLYLHSNSGINTTGYDTLSFAVYANQSSRLGVQLYDA